MQSVLPSFICIFVVIFATLSRFIRDTLDALLEHWIINLKKMYRYDVIAIDFNFLCPLQNRYIYIYICEESNHIVSQLKIVLMS